MPVYRVLYLKDPATVERFRSQGPPIPQGGTSLKPKDYTPVAEIEAPNEYAVWRLLQAESATERNLRPMGVGDVLEAPPGSPRVCRFVGFDDATWFTFEPKPKTPGPGDEASAKGTSEASESSSAPSAPDSPPNPPQ